jgi:hypothetical protein
LQAELALKNTGKLSLDYLLRRHEDINRRVFVVTKLTGERFIGLFLTTQNFQLSFQPVYIPLRPIPNKPSFQ